MLYDAEHMDTWPVLTPGDMRRTEQKAFEMGVPSILLMEHAAIAVTDELEKALGGSCRGREVLFLCGKGNNGGDGLAAARLFKMRGGRPFVWLYGPPRTPDAQANEKWLRQVMREEDILDWSALSRDRWPLTGEGPNRPFDAYVDALLGTGFRGEPDERMSRMMLAPYHDVHWIGTERDMPPVIAVDIPSGIDGSTGDTPGAFVHADVTVTFHAPKPGLYLTKNRAAVGRIVVADIGLWDMAPWRGETLDLPDPELNCEIMTPRALCRLPARAIGAHKGNCGRVLVYAGSLGMAGAAAMCARAAVTAGAGLTTIACEREIIPILQTLVPNAMCVDIRDAVKHPPAYDVLAVGCGLGQSEEAWQNILSIYDPEKPAVWDADALNMLSKHPMKLGEKTVITPHMGEAARLLGRSVEAIIQNRFTAARELMEKYGCVTVLKSDVTVICADTFRGPEYFLNTVGSPSLAKGGSGDVLTGILAAVTGGFLPIAEPSQTGMAAALSCLWHGAAGVVGARKYGERELNASQLTDCLYEAEIRAGEA